VSGEWVTGFAPGIFHLRSQQRPGRRSAALALWCERWARMPFGLSRLRLARSPRRCAVLLFTAAQVGGALLPSRACAESRVVRETASCAISNGQGCQKLPFPVACAIEQVKSSEIVFSSPSIYSPLPPGLQPASRIASAPDADSPRVGARTSPSSAGRTLRFDALMPHASRRRSVSFTSRCPPGRC